MENEENETPLTWSRAVLGVGAAPMTATEVRERRRDAYLRMKQEMLSKPEPAWVDEFVNETQRRIADAMAMQAERAEGYSLERLINRIAGIGRIAENYGVAVKEIGIVLQETQYDRLLHFLKQSAPLVDQPACPRSLLRASFRLYGVEILRGGFDRDTPLVCLRNRDILFDAHREALIAEIESRLSGDAVSELPQSASSNGVSPGAKPVSEVGIAPRPASGDDRNPNSLAHLSDEAKVIAAKEAIAAYARKKQLPSAAHLALFGELDGKRAGNKGRPWNPGKARLAACAAGRAVNDIDRNHHGLSAEPLGRAIDQIWVRENGGAYADLISSRSERLAEMVNRGDAAADGERG